MSNMKFKKNGTRVLESQHGDLLLCDPSLGIDVILSDNLILGAKDDYRKMKRLAEAISDFVSKNRELRWKRANANLMEIAKTDRDFVRKNTFHLSDPSVASLRKLETKVFMWKTEHGLDGLTHPKCL